MLKGTAPRDTLQKTVAVLSLCEFADDEDLGLAGEPKQAKRRERVADLRICWDGPKASWGAELIRGCEGSPLSGCCSTVSNRGVAPSASWITSAVLSSGLAGVSVAWANFL